MRIIKEFFLDKLISGLIDFIKEKKGENLRVIDVENVSSVGRYIFIVTTTSLPHSNALSKYIIDYVKENDKRPVQYSQSTEVNNPWQLIDAGDIIFNVFLQETRELYSLEKIYAKGVVIH